MYGFQEQSCGPRFGFVRGVIAATLTSVDDIEPIKAAVGFARARCFA
jgi:hypothetical protein